MADNTWTARFDARAGMYASAAGMGLRCGIAVNRTTINRVDAREQAFSVTWLLTGTGEYIESTEESGESSRPLADGALILRRSSRKSRLRLSGGSEQRRCYIDVDPSIAPLVALSLPETVELPSVISLPFSEQLLERFAAFVDDIRLMDSTRPLPYIVRLCEIVSALYGLSDTADGRINRAARMLVSKSYSIALPEIAEQCGMPYTQFRKLFTAVMGQTPGKWRIARRVDSAKQELAAGEPIASIAEHLGYSDVFSFTHQFRNVTGITPKQFQLRNIY